MIQDKQLGRKQFSFAVIADSHLNPDEVECNSPFPVNKLANRRMRYVIADLNQQDIDFVLHLGDLIHPVPAVEDLYLEAADRFKDQLTNLAPPMHLVPGNHDIGDKPMHWAPAGSITSKYVELWRDNFGPDYYSFSHDSCQFIIINAQLCNSGLTVEDEQEEWLQQELKNNRDKRIFISTHYPPFLHHAKEQEHYDNIAEPARQRLLDYCTHYGVEALFAGHVHNFWYLKHEQMSCYLLPSTAFVRQDYSEMLQAPPSAPEFESGRNDFAKLGYFLVHVYEQGHVVQMVRTYGSQQDEKYATRTTNKRISLASPRETRINPLGFDLRGEWANSRGIAPSGGLDEFDRKHVYNDYPLLGLTEMGTRKLRVPFQDLRNEQARTRMADYLTLGHEFVLFSFGLPGEEDISLVDNYCELLSGWEITTRISELTERKESYVKFVETSPIPVYLGKMWEHTNDHDGDKPYYHVINHGFTLEDEELLAELIKSFDVCPGLVFRLCADDNPHSFITEAATIGKKFNCPLSIHIRLAGANPAVSQDDDTFVTNRLLEAVISALPHTRLTLFADTLVDVDRGYFPRRGVLDDLCNPRIAAKTLMHLNGALNTYLQDSPDKIATATMEGVNWLSLATPQEAVAIALPTKQVANTITIPDGLFSTIHKCIDLISGEIFSNDVKQPTIQSTVSHTGNPFLLLGERVRGQTKEHLQQKAEVEEVP